MPEIICANCNEADVNCIIAGDHKMLCPDCVGLKIAALEEKNAMLKEAVKANHSLSNIAGAGLMAKATTERDALKKEIERLEKSLDEVLISVEDEDGATIKIRRSDRCMKNRLLDYVAHKDMMLEIESDGILCAAHNTLARSIREFNESHGEVEGECNKLETRAESAEKALAFAVNTIGDFVGVYDAYPKIAEYEEDETFIETMRDARAILDGKGE